MPRFIESMIGATRRGHVADLPRFTRRTARCPAQDEAERDKAEGAHRLIELQHFIISNSSLYFIGKLVGGNVKP